MPDGSQKKISELPVAPAAHPTDLLETSQADGTGYVSRSITLAQVAAGVVVAPPAWTDITGKPATFPPDPEAIDDRVAALLVAGTNITLAYNDPANTLTINSTASGGGSATLPAGSVGYGAVGNTLTGVLADFSWDSTNKRLGVGIGAPAAAVDVVVQANSQAIKMSGYSLTGSNATGCFSIAATLNTTGQPDVFAINITDTSNSGGNAFVIRGGPSGTAGLLRTTMSGDTRVAGWCQARLNDALVTNGADYFAYYLGNGSGGNIGMFAGLSNPTFSTFGRYGSIYLNGASPGLPYYNNNGTTGWDRLVGETSTQTITGKTFGATTFTGALTGTTATFSTNTLVGYGTAIPFSTYAGTANATPTLQVVGLAASLQRYTGGTNGPVLNLSKSSGASPGVQGLVGTSDILGQISFNGSDGVNFVEGAYIRALVDGLAPGVNDMPTRLSFALSPDGSATPGEVLRLQSTGNALLFKTLTAQAGTAIPAGGTTGAGYLFSSTANFGTIFGSGAPTASAARGSLYLRSDGGGPYVNTDGATTWSAVGGAVSVGTTAPASPTDGQLWYYSDASNGGGALYVRYNDGNTTQWVPASPAATPGSLIQTVFTETGAMAAGATVIPNDDTIPQITEGDEYMTCAITPRSATSKLIIDISFVCASTNVATVAMALFQDTTANALAVSHIAVATAGNATTLTLRHIMTSATTSATTFRVRAGPNVASTVTFNGLNSLRRMGGAMASSIVIQEVA